MKLKKTISRYTSALVTPREEIVQRAVMHAKIDAILRDIERTVDDMARPAQIGGGAR